MKNFTISRSDAHNKNAVAILCSEAQVPDIPFKSFEGKHLQTALLFGDNTTTLYVGIGNPKEITPLEIKEIGAKIARTFKAEKIFDFAIEPGSLPVSLDYFRSLPQGIVLGDYEFNLKSKADQEDELWDILLISGSTAAEEEDHAIQEGLFLAEGTVFARDVTNLPANHLRPADYAQRISDLLTPLGVEVEITGGEALKEIGMNGLYSIGHSSDFPPQLVVMRYNGGNSDFKTALVGKGITYDTGGYSLKPAGSMATMQGDMAGSAAVTGTLYALAKNKVKANVVGIAVLAENRLSNQALVPGDVYTAYNGTTVEVLNTDAEGRLVLADGVAYAVKNEKADRILDIATLTGAVVRSLGHGVAGTVTNDNALFEEIEKAGKLSGERYWNFPTYREYHTMIDSKVADIKNIGKPEGGSITGGLFIGHFAEETPWIHLDIAGTGWAETPLFEHLTTGATGTGVDTMYYFCKNKAE